MVSLVYMVGGLSSRFGGKLKQFANVGPNDETFIECSIERALPAGFDRIIFIVSDKTERPFRERFGVSYRGVPIFYAKQEFEVSDRDRPWGTADALACAAHLIDNFCVVCNGDDLYEQESFERVVNHLKSTEEDVTVALPLSKMIPEEGDVTRGVFETEEGYLVDAREEFNVNRLNYEQRGLSESLCNMNLFGLQAGTVKKMRERVRLFKEKNRDDRKIECFIHVEFANLVKSNEAKMRVYEGNGEWIGLTNPEDEEVVRNFLKG